METKNVYKLYSRDQFREYRAEIINFHEELRSNGYVYLESTPEVDNIMNDLLVISERFFSMSAEQKNNFTKPVLKNQTIWNLFGASCMSNSTEKVNNYSGKWKRVDPNPREYYDIRFDCHDLIDSDFEQKARRGFEVFNELARGYLEQVFYPLGIDESYLSDITTSGYDNLTGIKMLKYTYNGESEKETCLRHTDRGLITISYCLQSGLTAKDFHSHQWSDIEYAAPKRPCLLLFTGETLSRLTGGYFKAILHKVVSKTDRYSFPFFYRARSIAVLDMKLLKSVVLQELLQKGELEDYPPITVKDLDNITKIQYDERSMPLELGGFKKETYWSFNDDIDQKQAPNDDRELERLVAEAS